MGQDKADMPPERVSAFAAAIVASVLGLTAIGGAVDISRLDTASDSKAGHPVLGALSAGGLLRSDCAWAPAHPVQF